MKNDKKIESETKSKKIDDKKAQFDHELIISALTRLKDLIKREENLIEKKQYSDSEKLIPDTLELVNFFARNKDDILNSYDLTKEEDKQKREEIKNLVQNLLNNSNKNINKIKKAQYIGSKVMEIIKESVHKNQMKNKNYNISGKSEAKYKNKNIMLDKEV